MTKNLKQYLQLIESRQALMEANVINPQDVDRWVARWVKAVKLPEGQAWMQKKLRTLAFNGGNGLVHLHDITAAFQENPARFGEQPDYVHAAVARGEPIYQFGPESSTATISNTLQHIADWFNGMADFLKRTDAKAAKNQLNPVEVEDRTLTQKEITKLMKLDVPTAYKAADAWFNHIGARLKDKAGLEGVNVVYEWDDGYYAVTFQTEQAMMVDGRALQNCLQQAYYWKAVASKQMQVYAIRKPNDEAVVGIRVTLPGYGQHGQAVGPKLAEVKGKNNKPASPAYVPYIVDLLTHLHIDGSNNHDLKAAGIYYNNGKYGTFEDVAEVVYDQDGIKVVSDGERCIARMGKGQVSMLLGGGFTGGEANPQAMREIQDVKGLDTNELKKVLSAIPFKPTENVIYALKKDYGIFYHNGRYGGVSEVGKKLATVGNLTFYETGDMIYGLDPSGAAHMTLSTNSTGAIAGSNAITLHGGSMPDILNALGRKPEPQFEAKLDDSSIYFDGKTYGSLEEVGKLDVEHIWRLGKRSVWIVVLGNANHRRLAVHAGVLKGLNYIPRVEDAGIEKSVQALVTKHKFKSVEGGATFGIFNCEALGKAIASEDEFFANLNTILAHENLPYYLSEGVMDFFTGRALKPAHVAMLVQEFHESNASAPQAKVLNTQTRRAADMDVPHYKLILATAGVKAFAAMQEKTSKPQIPKVLADDLRQAVLYAAKLVAQNEGIYDNLGGSQIASLVAAAPKETDALNKVMQQVTDKVRAAAEERVNNPDKYAKDISSRFAALNYKRGR